MQVEYRLTVKTRHGSTHRWPMKNRDKAIESGKVYVDTASPFYSGSDVMVECRQIGEWHNAIVSDDTCKED